MTSAGGAGAMAAAPGPRAGAGAEGQRRLLRAVTRLQACARGFLLRRRLRSVRAEFEAVVLEIEGDLRQLRWSGRVLQSPRFGPEPSAGNPLDPGEAAENRTIPRKTRAELGPRGAARAGNIPSSAPNPKNPPTPPDLGRGAAQSPEEEEEEEEEGALAWASDGSELGASPGIPEELQGLPRRELQSHREHLLLELLWVQQAISSREHFLLLKQKLGVPSSTPRSCPAGEKPRGDRGSSGMASLQENGRKSSCGYL